MGKKFFNLPPLGHPGNRPLAYTSGSNGNPPRRIKNCGTCFLTGGGPARSDGTFTCKLDADSSKRPPVRHDHVCKEHMAAGPSV